MRLQNKLFLMLMMMSSAIAGAAELSTIKVREASSGDTYIAEGIVEAVQQSVISPQVTGRITQLTVKAGDRVQKGQGGLSDQDAVDVAEYFSHQSRPDYPDKDKDWPKDKKPVDTRY